jgi:IMP dehydrogenase
MGHCDFLECPTEGEPEYMTSVREILRLKKDHRQVWTIDAANSAYAALQLMTTHNVGSLLVVREGRIVGLVTERDFTRKCALKQSPSRETPVSEIMSAPVLYVTPDDTADACMALMTESRVRHLPVLDCRNLVGLISMGDIVKAIVADREFLIDELIRYITGSATVDTDSVYRKNPEEVPVRII